MLIDLLRTGVLDFTDKTHDEFGGSPAIHQDVRLEYIRHTDSALSFDIPCELAVWENRRQNLAERILFSAGLWPMPARCGLNASLSDLTLHEGFTVEKVRFESHPGFFVTGNLYRPVSGAGPFPVILNPHGHWSNGRLEQSAEVNIPVRCANFAKMGFIALAYDMIGYTDSRQVTHTFGGYRAELWNIGAFGLQLYNSIRALDFIETLPDADPSRIGCTGASGGATQTLFLAAVDPRVKVTALVNMVSFTMQGGCNCENAPLLRLQTNNVEIAGLMAPRPAFLSGSTGDWTRNNPVLEFPAIASIYSLYGARENVGFFFQDAPHNYNQLVREQVYAWFIRHFTGEVRDWAEKPVALTAEQLRIDSVEATGPDQAGNQVWFERLRQQRKDLLGQLLLSLRENEMQILRRHLAFVLGGGPGDRQVIAFDNAVFIDDDLKQNELKQSCLLRRQLLEIGAGIQLPRLSLDSIHSDAGHAAPSMTIVALHPQGKAAAFERLSRDGALEKALVAGARLISADLFLTGEYHRPFARAGRSLSGARHFTTFNYSDDALRVSDLLSVMNYVRSSADGQIFLLGYEAAGLWCLAALPFLDERCHVVVDAQYLAAADEDNLLKYFAVPGFLAAGGFEACLRLSAAKQITLFNLRQNSEGTDFGHKMIEAGIAVTLVEDGCWPAAESIR